MHILSLWIYNATPPLPPTGNSYREDTSNFPSASAHIPTRHLADSNRNIPPYCVGVSNEPISWTSALRAAHKLERTHGNTRIFPYEGLAAYGSKIKKRAVSCSSHSGVEQNAREVTFPPGSVSVSPPNNLWRRFSGHADIRLVGAYMWIMPPSPSTKTYKKKAFVSFWHCFRVATWVWHISFLSAASLSDRANDAALTFIDPSPQVTTSPLLFLFGDAVPLWGERGNARWHFMRSSLPVDCFYES